MNIDKLSQVIWAIDDEENILDYKFSNGVSYWLAIRHDIYRTLHKKVFETHSIYNENRAGFLQKVRRLLSTARYILKSQINNPLKVKRRYNLLNFCSSVSVIKEGDTYNNRISGFINDIKGIKVLNIYQSNNQQYYHKYKGDYSFFDALLPKAMRKRPNKPLSHKESSDLFISILNKHLSGYLTVKELQNVKQSICDSEQNVSYFQQSVRKLFSQTKPLLILLEDGNYGSAELCTIIKVAKEENIKTVEIQHGTFDLAFKYSPKLIKDIDFAKHKTDIILTFGDYFSDYIQSSSKKIAIGNYFLEKRAATLKNKNLAKKILLFVTQLHYTDEIIPILYQSMKMLSDDYKLIIRLHPLDYEQSSRYNCLLECSDSELSKEGDIYQLLVDAEFVIGSYSTVLYEGVYFSKNILIHKNQLSDYYIPEQLGKRFSSSKELTELLTAVSTPEFPTKCGREYFWTTGCEERFKAVLADINNNPIAC